MSFVHLHLHTSYSLLDGSGRIPEMISRAKELGQNAMAITDHGVMFGCIEFYEECLRQGIKPILGCEVYVSPGSRFDREVSKGEEKYNHLILLAKNNDGYNNLIKIVSAGFLDGYYYKPRVDYEILEKYHDGLICSSACLAGEIPKYILANKYEEACNTAKKMQEIFGKENYYLELQDHGYDEQKIVNISLVRMSKELGIPLIATNDVHYTLDSDVEAHDALLCIQTGKKVSDENRMRYLGGQFYIKSEDEMRELFPYALEAIDNTQKIANQCNVEILFTNKTHKYHLPIFTTPNGLSSVEYLKQLTNEGLKKRYTNIDNIREDRLKYELDTIINMGFTDYFLIVQDYINYAKSQGIPVGPGRGSAAGSLVAYTLGITDVDPIKYDLLFERFLNPERVTMPDIDVDFCEARRGEVIEYVTKKYGEKNVSQIVTFGTLKPKAVFKDVARVLDISFATANIISKLIPSKYDGKVDTVTYDILLYGDIGKFDINDQPKVIELREFYNNDSSIRKAMNLCKRLEGIPRHASMHASGILIAPSSIDDYVTLVRLNDTKGTSSIVAGENMVTLERLGLLKMDFLGLRNLTAINEAKKIIKNKYNVDIDFSNDEYNDKKIFDMISKGETSGVFQLESAGMTNFMKELKPECIEDIIAGISLFRPGPMDFIPKYIEGKKNKENIKYDCPQLKPILEATYGCIVYQEQVMQIFRQLAGYSFGGADLVRRAMSKKHGDELERERTAFIFGDADRGIKGCVLNGIKDSVASKIFDDVVGFGKYAFNKSHATAYGFLAYQTAYLKYYYPLEFICALCNSVINDRKSLFPYIRYAKSLGIKILSPNINKSLAYFQTYENSLLMGFAGLMGLATSLSDIIIKERETNGEYKSFYDFISRLKDKGINKTAIESLIFTGAFDCFEGNRMQKMAIYPLLLKDNASQQSKSVEGQMSIMDMVASNNDVEDNINTDKEILSRFSNLEEYSKDELYRKEREISGLYLSGHPLEMYSNVIKRFADVNTSLFEYKEGEKSKLEDMRERVKLAGICSDINIKMTKKSEQMAIIRIEDEYGDIEGIVFPNVLKEVGNILAKNEKYLFTGHVDFVEDSKSKLMVDKIETLESKSKMVIIEVEDANTYQSKYNEIVKICRDYYGDRPVLIRLKKEKLEKILNGICVNASSEFINKLKEKEINASLENT